MENNIDIFITAFKPFKEYVNNNVYKVVGVKGYKYDGKLESFNDNNGENISSMNHFFNELSVFYWVWKNFNMKEYIGMCSYRRYFTFFDDIDSIKYSLSHYDIILPKKVELKGLSVYEHYGCFHNSKDLDLILDILNKKFPFYRKSVDNVMSNNFLYINNMFIMKRIDYIKYCEFVFYILFEYLKQMNFNCYDDILRHVENNSILYYKGEEFMKTSYYQSRIGGFLAERLFNIFIDYNFDKIIEIPILFTSSIEN